MKIFENKVSSVASTREVGESNVDKMGKSAKAKGPSRKKAAKPEKPNISADEIRQKLASNVEMSNTAKKIQKEKNAQKLGEGFLNGELPAKKIEAPAMAKEVEKPESKVEESADPNFKDHIVKSDVGINDPKDSTTTEKLKTVISKGAFNFNSREREILDKILND